VYFPGVGWVPFDATDGSEDISDHSVHQRVLRVNFLAWLFSHGALPPLLLAALAAAAGVRRVTELLPRLRRTSQDRVADARPATNRQVVAAYLQGLLLFGEARPGEAASHDTCRVSSVGASESCGGRTPGSRIVFGAYGPATTGSGTDARRRPKTRRVKHSILPPR